MDNLEVTHVYGAIASVCWYCFAKTKKTCCRTFMGIKQDAYQHCFRALTPFSMFKEKNNRYVLAVYWILTDFFSGFSGLRP